MATSAAAGSPLAGAAVAALAQAYAFWEGLPFRAVFAGHALFCTASAAEFRDRWLVQLLLTFLWGNGGGVLSALLLMTPEEAPLSFLSSNYVPLCWLVCWWLVNHMPGGHVRSLVDRWYIRVFTHSCTSLLRALLIVSRVDLAARLFPGVAAAPLILGTISGCGGRLFADAIFSGWEVMPGLAELTTPGFISRSAAMAAMTYYTLGHHTQALPLAAAAGLVVSALMLHTLASELTGLALDFTAPVTHVLHVLTRVPLPPPQPTPEPVTVVRSVSSPALAAKAQRRTPAKAPPAKATPYKTPLPEPKAEPQAEPASPAAAPAAVAAAPPPTTGARKRRGAASSSAAAAAAACDASDAPAPAVAGVQTRRSQRRAAAAPA